ncbi:MAG: HAD-IA family hydrolase, partial [Albidovulum sp.]
AFCAEIGHPMTAGEIAALHAEKTRHYAAMMAAGEITLRPGVARVMAEARARGVALVIATTTSRENVEALTRAVWGATGAEMFDVIAAGDEVAAKKPAPDVYLLALERLALPPDVALAFEDSRNGLLSARGAGLRTIVTPSIYTADEDFTGALAVMPDLAHFSPFATGKAAAMG